MKIDNTGLIIAITVTSILALIAIVMFSIYTFRGQVAGSDRVGLQYASIDADKASRVAEADRYKNTNITSLVDGGSNGRASVLPLMSV